MIRHNSLMNRLEWMNRTYGMSEKDIILQKTPFTFDAVSYTHLDVYKRQT